MVFCRWLSEEPLILYYGSQPYYDVGTELPAKRVYRLAMFHSHVTSASVEREHAERQSRRPQDVFNYLINEREVYSELVARGIAATFTNQNAMLDEGIFTIQGEVEKVYDAVYNARMVPMKRHALARHVPSLLMIGGVFWHGHTRDYFDRLLAEMPHAHFTHAEENRWLPAAEIVGLLNRARVGLCLSAVEGAMYAATEYLLCGLPVVSTVSVGGRSEWFESDWVRVVPAEPEVIHQAVQELIALQISPQRIREGTLSKISEHRKRFIDLVQSIYVGEGVARDFAGEWPRLFRNRLGTRREAGTVLQFLGEDLSEVGERSRQK
jgi:glycosyltransferase involved in cell wall biosynthesis